MAGSYLNYILFFLLSHMPSIFSALSCGKLRSNIWSFGNIVSVHWRPCRPTRHCWDAWIENLVSFSKSQWIRVWNRVVVTAMVLSFAWSWQQIKLLAQLQSRKLALVLDKISIQQWLGPNAKVSVEYITASRDFKSWLLGCRIFLWLGIVTRVEKGACVWFNKGPKTTKKNHPWKSQTKREKSNWINKSN